MQIQAQPSDDHLQVSRLVHEGGIIVDQCFRNGAVSRNLLCLFQDCVECVGVSSLCAVFRLVAHLLGVARKEYVNKYTRAVFFHIFS